MRFKVKNALKEILIINTNKKILLIITFLLIMCTGISISYAFFKVASSNNNANTNVTINGAALCMSLQLNSNNITLSNEYAVPISDSKALSSDTYKTSVTITNNCNTSQSFNLLLVPNSSNTMPIKALKYALVEEGVTPTSGTLISNEYLLDSTIQKQLLAIKNETLKNGFSVGSGTVSSGTKAYSLYLWIDKDEGSLGNGSTMNKSLNAYLTLGSGTNTFDLRLYQTISNKYENGDEHVKLYNPTEYGDNTTYGNSIYYYHGAAQNNNLLFGGFCWKIVRTTETGGVKIVYNGIPFDTVNTSPIELSSYANISNDATYPYTFDSTSKTWVSTNKTNSATGTITFKIATAGDYYLSYDVSSEADCDIAKFYKNGTAIGDSNGYSDTVSGTIALVGLTTSDVIKVEYTKDGSGARGSDTVKFSIGKAIGGPVKSCNNTGTDSQIGISKFNNSFISPAYVGYMYNTVYQYSSKPMSSQSNIVFGNSFTYANGAYTLADTKTVAKWSSGHNTINNNHYTCMTTGTTCSSIYYVYYADSSSAYYITLTGGKSVDDALNEMLYADNVNTKDSTIKTYIDSWYESNLASYEDKLEDTVFCNDRSMSNESSNGWNPNGGSTSTILQFKNSSTSNKSLVCTNVTDRFSISNPKAKLKHPIGLLSVPELSLAGYQSSHYFNNKQYVWLVSPHYFSYYGARVGVARSEGFIDNYVDSSGGVRPSISLKSGTEFKSGDGSFTNPFIIE